MDDPDGMWSFFSQIVTSCLDRYVPFKKVKSKYSKRPTPWITSEIMSAIRRSKGPSVLLRAQGTVRVLLYISVLKITTAWSAKLRCLRVLLYQSRKCSHLAAKLLII